MGEQQARAVLYALPARFKQDKKRARSAAARATVQWLETQHRIFDEIEGATIRSRNAAADADARGARPSSAPARGARRRPRAAAREAIVERRASS